MEIRTKKTIGYAIGFIGFVSSVIGIWTYVYKPVPDSEIFLLPDSFSDIEINSQEDISKLSNPVKAKSFNVNGVKVELLKGQVVIANKIKLKNGAEIIGDSITLVSTQMDGGRVSSNRIREGMHGGDLLLAVAMINGTAIESNGAAGRNGADGVDGVDGGAGASGRRGKCKGFGGWKSAQAGSAGANGRDGGDGKNGERGGDAGNIIVLTSYELTAQPMAEGGEGGNGGRGGAEGRGGPGGRGGSGCTGAGGSQDGKASGVNGTDGKSGKDGLDGASGQSKNPNIKLIDFSVVKDIVENQGSTTEELVTSLRSIRPKSS